MIILSRPINRAAFILEKELMKMTLLDKIKSEIRRLYETNPDITVNLVMNSPKVCLNNCPAIIKGVYPHIFQIEEHSSDSPKCYTIQYTDILTGHIEIAELNINQMK